nr:AbrB/MazE/SpoVT family DNA-binding domain-containing protein [uncultured Anaerocolumna sp.]
MVKGIVRPIDDLGRLVIPKEFRKSLKIKEKDPVDIYLKDGVICIEPFKLQCVCCGNRNENKLVVVDGVHMCPDCVEKFSKSCRRV